MAKVLNCECGYTVRGETDDELVERATEHLTTLHPEIAKNVTRDDVLSMSEEEPAPS